MCPPSMPAVRALADLILKAEAPADDPDLSANHAAELLARAVLDAGWLPPDTPGTPGTRGTRGTPGSRGAAGYVIASRQADELVADWLGEVYATVEAARSDLDDERFRGGDWQVYELHPAAGS